MKKKGVSFIDFGTFPGVLCFAWGLSYGKIVSRLKKMGEAGEEWALGISGDEQFIDSNSCLALHRALQDDDAKDMEMFYIIFTDKWEENVINIVKLAHEVLHILQFYLPGVLDRTKEHEAECYLHTHIMRKCLSVIYGSEI